MSSHSSSHKSKKRKSTDKDEEDKKRQKPNRDEESFNVYKDFARWIVRSEHLFISWYGVLDTGLKADAEDYEDYDQFMKQYQIEINIYRRMHMKNPQFAQDIKKMKKKAKYEKEIISLLRNASRGARSDDSNSLLIDGLEYISAIYGPLKPPISARHPKADVRGFNHPMITRLLCPVDYLESLDKDPEGFSASLLGCFCADGLVRFCNEVLNGSIKIHSTDFPLCLYDEEQIDKEDPSAGLLRSKVLVAFFKHIFFGPSTALKDGPGGSKAKRGQARRNNMKKPTAGSIAYAATQLRWCLSASDDWRLGDGNWDPEKFYGAIMRAFGINLWKKDSEDEDEEDEETRQWADGLIAWFNIQVFMEKSVAEPTTPVRGSTLDTLLAKRKAQRAAKSAFISISGNTQQTVSSPGPRQTSSTYYSRKPFSSPIRPPSSYSKGRARELYNNEMESESELERGRDHNEHESNIVSRNGKENDDSETEPDVESETERESD